MQSLDCDTVWHMLQVNKVQGKAAEGVPGQPRAIVMRKGCQRSLQDEPARAAKRGRRM